MPKLRAAALVVVLVLSLEACAEAAPTPVPSDPPAPSGSAASAAESTAPSPTPEPTPVDASQAAITRLADPTLTANVTFEATTTLGSATTTSSGTIEIDGRSSHMVRTDTSAKAKTTTESVTGNSTRYARQKGVWTRVGDSTDTELIAVLRAVTALEDVGVENRDGQSLHHLQATGLPTPPAELAIASEGVTNLETSLDGWVREDGTPVTFTFASTWTQDDGGTPVEASKTATFTFADVGSDITVAVPARTWTFTISKVYGYRMAYPSDWELEKGSAKFTDTYFGVDEVVYASRGRRNGVSLSTINREILDQLREMTEFKSLKITTNRKATLDGVAGRRIEYQGTDSGDAVYGQAVFTIKGPWWYFIGFDSFTKTNDETRALFDTFLGTFDYR